jgi:hypothetical protein
LCQIALYAPHIPASARPLRSIFAAIMPPSSTIATLLDIAKYTIPALVVMLCAYLLINKFLNSEISRKQIALLGETQNVTIPLRLQAYERLTIFVERVHPRLIVPRVYVQGMTVAELRGALVFTINMEFEHNLSQQIYVTRQVWESVRQMKEQEIAMIHQIASTLPESNPGKELHGKIVDYILTTEGTMPSEIALQIISDEAKRVLSYGPNG